MSPDGIQSLGPRAARGVTRRRVMALALERFALNGFHGVSIGDLAGDLGLSKAAVMHHSGSKEGLYRDVLAMVAEGLQAATTTAMDSAQPPRARVEALIVGILDWGEANPAQVQLITRELMDVAARSGPRKHWPLTGIVRSLVSVLEDARSARMLATISPFVGLELVLGAATYRQLAAPARGPIMGLAPDSGAERHYRGDIAAALKRALLSASATDTES